MAKRFIDTEIFKKNFIKKLSPEYKLLWLYILNDCNHAGIWEVDFDVAGLRIGQDINSDEALKAFKEKVIVFSGGNKWFIPSFITFQYGPELVTTNRMHVPIIQILNSQGLMGYFDGDIVDQGTTKNALRGRITKKVREAILLRDGMQCQYCSERKDQTELEIDHVTPLSKGGNNEDENLAAACVRCNKFKSDYELKVFLEKDHEFLKPTDRIKKLLNAPSYSLEAPYKKLEGAMEKEQEKDKDKEKDKDQEIPRAGKFKITGIKIEEIQTLLETKGMGHSRTLPEMIAAWKEFQQINAEESFDDITHAKRMFSNWIDKKYKSNGKPNTGTSNNNGRTQTGGRNLTV